MTRANAARPYSTKMTGVIEDLAAGGVGIDELLSRSPRRYLQLVLSL